MSSRALLMALVLVCHTAAFARRPPNTRVERGAKAASKTPKTPIDEFDRMSSEQQQRALQRLPPGQRQKLQERLQRFNQLPREQQQTLRNLYTRLHQLPANRQDSVRKAINRFSEQTPDRQRAVRDELRLLATTPKQDRESRMASREFRQSFSRKEQGIVRDLIPVLPNR